MQAFALQSFGRICNPAADLVLLKPIFVYVLLCGGCCFHRLSNRRDLDSHERNHGHRFASGSSAATWVLCFCCGWNEESPLYFKRNLLIPGMPRKERSNPKPGYPTGVTLIRPLTTRPRFSNPKLIILVNVLDDSAEANTC